MSVIEIQLDKRGLMAKIDWWDVFKVFGNWSLTIIAIFLIPAWNKWQKARKSTEEAKKVAAQEVSDKISLSLEKADQTVTALHAMRADMKALNHDLTERISAQGITLTKLEETVHQNHLAVKEDVKLLHGRIDGLQQQHKPIK